MCVELRDAYDRPSARWRDQVRGFRDSSRKPAAEKGDQEGMWDEQLKQRMKELCDLIAQEQDHHRFSTLVAELNRLLDDCYPTPPTNLKKEKL